MSLIVYLGKMLEIKVCVNLGGADVRMAQHFLHAAHCLARAPVLA